MLQSLVPNFETYLKRKFDDLIQVDDEIYTFKFSVNKSGLDYCGEILVESSKGRFFASGISSALNEIANMLFKKIKNEMTECKRLGPLSAIKYAH